MRRSDHWGVYLLGRHCRRAKHGQPGEGRLIRHQPKGLRRALTDRDPSFRFAESEGTRVGDAHIYCVRHSHRRRSATSRFPWSVDAPLADNPLQRAQRKPTARPAKLISNAYTRVTPRAAWAVTGRAGRGLAARSATSRGTPLVALVSVKDFGGARAAGTCPVMVTRSTSCHSILLTFR